MNIKQKKLLNILLNPLGINVTFDKVNISNKVKYKKGYKS